MEKRNSKCEHGPPRLVLPVRLRSGWLSITTPVSLRSCQSNLCCSRGYERLQKSKDALKAYFESVNIVK